MRLWLVRHAQPDIAAGHCYGSTDITADTAATRDCAAALAALLPASLAVWTSPLQRCRQLADALRSLRPGLEARPDARLAEMHFGAWENRPWCDIAREELDAWTADFPGYATGDHGETVAGFMQRVAQAMDDLQAPAQAGRMDRLHPADQTDTTSAPPGDAGDTLWITHAGVIRAAALIAAGRRSLRQADEWPSEAPGFGQWCVLDWHGEVHNHTLQGEQPAAH
ncbi:MAG: histidine phosphatase family protein [Polaromonas sp.]|nr:histidine phosphatase family protein [Polaromonas sp.]